MGSFRIFDVTIMFFFFKQKPAYGLRISDWSSDVCSSDLTDAGMAVEGDEQRDVFGELEITARLMITGGSVIRKTERIFPSISGRSQIGRASCRERVCQYV